MAYYSAGIYDRLSQYTSGYFLLIFFQIWGTSATFTHETTLKGSMQDDSTSTLLQIFNEKKFWRYWEFSVSCLFTWALHS